MNNKRHTLLLVSLVLEAGIIISILTFKLIYYIDKYQRDFFSTFIEFLLWTIISILISVIPTFFLLKSNIYLIKRNASSDINGAQSSLCLKLIVGNIIFEITSILGATMSLDGSWMDIAFKMLICHLISIIPYAMVQGDRQKIITFIWRTALLFTSILLLYIFSRIIH